MAILNNCFYGELHGKKISDFTKELDYSINSVEDRIEYVKEKIDHEYFDDLFTQTFDSKISKEGVFWNEQEDCFMSYLEISKWCKKNNIDIDEYLAIKNPFESIIGGENAGEWNYTNSNTSNIKLVLNTTESLYSESNVAKELCKLADYILAKDNNTNKVEYKFYTDEGLFKKKIKEQEFIHKISQETNKENEVVHYLKRKGQNFKKEKKQVVTNKDIDNNTVLKEYQDSLDNYRGLISSVVKHENDKKEGKLSISKEEYNKLQRYKYLCKKHIALTKEDMVYIKDSMNGTIYFKNVLADSGEPDWSMINFFDRSHIKALLLLGQKDITTDLGAITHDLETLLNSIKLRDRERIALNLWRRGQTLESIGNEIGVSNQAVDKMINMICKKIMKEYELVYAKNYYLNIVKSDYQVCSCCEESLPANILFFHFDSTNKRFRSRCKKCISRKNK